MAHNCVTLLRSFLNYVTNAMYSSTHLIYTDNVVES